MCICMCVCVCVCGGGGVCGECELTDLPGHGEVFFLVLDGLLVLSQLTQTLPDPPMGDGCSKSLSHCLRQTQLCPVVLQCFLILPCVCVEPSQEMCVYVVVACAWVHMCVESVYALQCTCGCGITIYLVSCVCVCVCVCVWNHYIPCLM